MVRSGIVAPNPEAVTIDVDIRIGAARRVECGTQQRRCGFHCRYRIAGGEESVVEPAEELQAFLAPRAVAEHPLDLYRR